MESFTHTWAQMWNTRPVRMPDTAGAGVSEGIGVRYQIDPTLVRIAFVVLTFLGAGIPLYILAWGFMPKYSLAQSPMEALFGGKPVTDKADKADKVLEKERRNGIALIIAFVLLGGLSAFSLSDIPAFSGVVLAALAWWALHARTPEPPVGLLVRDAGREPTHDLSSYAPADGHSAPFQTPTPPAWDPLGAAPGLWHLPEPGDAPEPTPEKPRRGRKIVLVGVTVALLVALASAAGLGIYRADVKVENMDVAVEDQLQPLYQTGIGNITVDFSNLKPLEESHDVTVRANIGHVMVTLPEHVAVELTCTNSAGNVTCPDSPVMPEGVDPNAPRLHLHLESGVGNLTVQES
ncbi:PspC domain-containing protein [Corynebacterium kozikiae]|uniref:PspC domain-containing protein n=1 Tax=Corynebacterium kozikiae TaxID=2968469 RepID=UPI00211C7333|nr:PspC domain-containing protein [Corynebacterium sp. 76QC2CO]MCQ9343184.1 PspC domain-containing protein [Corynebacterium sp. 76QC2CO]